MRASPLELDLRLGRDSRHFALLGLHLWAECVVSPVLTALNQAELKKTKMCTGCKYVCQSWNIYETFLLFFIQVVSGNMIDVGTELCAL